MIGGETEGVSGEAYRLCHQMGGSRIQIPLRFPKNKHILLKLTPNFELAPQEFC